MKTLINRMAIVLFVGCFLMESSQTAVGQELNVGDTIPAALYDYNFKLVNHADNKHATTLRSFDSQLVILDFWATWCSFCIQSMRKMDTLQRQFENEVTIIPITTQESRIANQKLKEQRIALPSIVEGGELRKFFPYRTVPHYVWIKKGIVIAISGHEGLTEVNINKALTGELKLRRKKDLFIDHLESISKHAAEQHSKVYIQSFLGGRIYGTGGVGRIINDSLQSYYRLNVPFVSLYRENLAISNNEILIESDSLLSLQTDPDAVFCYQLIAGVEIPWERILKKTLTELDMSFGVRSGFERRKITCIILKDAAGQPKMIGALVDEPENTGIAVDDMMRILNHSVRWLPNQPIFKNESGYSGKIVYEALKQFEVFREDISALEDFLRPYGIEVCMEERDMDVFVISDN